MFRKTTLLAAAVALVLMAPLAHAAAKGDWSIDFNGGTGIPMGDFKDAAKLGFMGGVGATYMVSNALGLGVDGAFIKNSPSDDLKTFLDPVTVKFSMLQGGAHVKYMFPMSEESKINPYVVAGAGIYNFKAKFEGTGAPAEESDSKFGGRGGLGLMFKASGNVNVGMEGTFHHIATDGSSTQFVGLQAAVSVGMGQPK